MECNPETLKYPLRSAVDTLKPLNNNLMQDELIYGREYHLWKDGKYLGIGFYNGEIVVSFQIRHSFYMDDLYYISGFSLDFCQLASELVENDLKF